MCMELEAVPGGSLLLGHLHTCALPHAHLHHPQAKLHERLGQRAEAAHYHRWGRVLRCSHILCCGIRCSAQARLGITSETEQ